MMMMGKLTYIRCLASRAIEIMSITLLGYAETKRTKYFLKAAQALGITVVFRELPQLVKAISAGHIKDFLGQNNCIIKIDPPEFNSYYVDDLPRCLASYERCLYALQDCQGLAFLNRPAEILHMLDKLACKKRLQAANLSVSPLVAAHVPDYLTLKEILCERQNYNVFIKLNKGSGACGVIAYRFNPKRGQAMAYTSLDAIDGRLVNTKKLRRFTEEKGIQIIVDQLCQQGVLVERWIPKMKYQNAGYDLRVVYQFGRMAYMIGRQSSSGPITNLHLNNEALAVEKLGLSEATVAAVTSLCAKAMDCYQGEVHCAGIDILLEKGSMKPYIIEMNGQGDLLYQDIYQENSVYKMQLREMVKNART